MLNPDNVPRYRLAAIVCTPHYVQGPFLPPHRAYISLNLQNYLRCVAGLLQCRHTNLLVIVHHLLFNSLVEHIDLGLGELPGTDATLEQDIKLSKGAILGFGESEVCVDEAAECDSALSIVSILSL